jgi:hypothetical protein
MKKVRIYMRSLSRTREKENNRLMLFDSNRNGAINDLVTEVPAGSTIIWKSDRCSGISRILRIYSKTGKGNVFHTEPRKRLLCKSFILRLSQKAAGEENYSIEYLKRDKIRAIIDPVIRIPPPE